MISLVSIVPILSNPVILAAILAVVYNLAGYIASAFK